MIYLRFKVHLLHFKISFNIPKTGKATYTKTKRFKAI